MATALIDCDTSIWPPIDSSVFFRLVMPSTVEICASWDVSSAFCIGFSGSWFFICVISSEELILQALGGVQATGAGLRQAQPGLAGGLVDYGHELVLWLSRAGGAREMGDQDWPMVSVFCIRLLAVLSTSTLA